MDVSGFGKKRKTSYSRKGCLQCKKSHLKCDEGQPKCGKCIKRNIQCTYQLSLVFQDVSELKMKTLPVVHSVMNNNVEGEMRLQELRQQQQQQQTSSSSSSSSFSDGQGFGRTGKRSHSSPYTRLVDMSDFKLQNFVYVSPSDASLLKLPSNDGKAGADAETDPETDPDTDADADANANANANVLARGSVPLLKEYNINWRNFAWVDMLKLLEKEDPCQEVYQGPQPALPALLAADDDSLVNSPKLNSFIWRFATTTLIAGNFLLFPSDRFDVLMSILWKLNQKHTIIQDAIRYDISVFMQDVYGKAHLSQFAQVWDQRVRAVSFKHVLGIINERIKYSQDFVEYVCLTFTVFLMFFANSALRSNLWRTHLRGCQHLLIRASILMPKGPLTELEQNAREVYTILRDWFCYAVTTASLASNYGITLIDISEFTRSTFLSKSSPLAIAGNGFNILRGMSNNLNMVYFKVLTKTFDMRDNGIDITGLNIIVFKLNRTTSSLLPQLSAFGRETLNELQHSAVLDENLEMSLSDVNDLRLRFSMISSHNMFFLLLELYLKVYFIDMDPTTPEIKSILYKMVKTAYSNPYYSSCGVCCHPSLFIGGLTCILARDDFLYFHFIDLLSKIADTGMAVAQNSIDKLNAIRSKIALGNFQNIIDPNHDFIPI